MNYHNWFYEFQKYIKGIDDYNDTNWVDIGKRYQRLLDLNSTLLNEQPYNVVGNRTGFEKLLELLTKSNYQYKDIDASLVKTYKQSLRRAMSEMLVNTHAVIFHAKNLKDKNIRNEKFTSNYIVDIPYDQLHFGERDEFIRQKLQKMHDSVNKQFIPVEEFTSNPFTKILDFTCICTINGKICHECSIGFDDHGLLFKFNYGGVFSAEVIIYKLDHTDVITRTISKSDLASGIGTFPEYANRIGIVDLFIPELERSSLSIPAFCQIDQDGKIQFILQEVTKNVITKALDKIYNVRIYLPKHLCNVKGVFPAINYMNMAKLSDIYTDLENPITTIDENRILGKSTTHNTTATYPVCTPPICLDRDYSISFNTVWQCLQLRNNLSSLKTSVLNEILDDISNGISTYESFKQVQKKFKYLRDTLNSFLMLMVGGATILGMEDIPEILEFTKFVQNIQSICELDQNWNRFEAYLPDELYGDYYEMFVQHITSPFINHESLSPFANVSVSDISHAFDAMSTSPSTRFNRPISEQCFIALEYSDEEEAWLFAYPDMKHCKGIENTFYIDDVNGNEIFKFFVLYTDTFYPSADEINDAFSQETVLDYDTFITEVEHHLGFIRYWELENSLMKLSKIYYGEYTDQNVVQVISDIMKQRIDAKDVIHQYWTQIQYDIANTTSDQYQAYNERSERAPFNINYLFYTLSMLHENDDLLQAFFYRTLTDDKFNARYLDYNVSNIAEDQQKLVMNFSEYSSSETVNTNGSVALSDGKNHLYMGMRNLYNGTRRVSTDVYPFSFTMNSGDGNHQFYLVDGMKIDTSHYLKASLMKQSFGNHIQLAKLFTKYLHYAWEIYAYLNTNYRIGPDQRFAVESARESLDKVSSEIKTFLESTTDDTSFRQDASAWITMFETNTNPDYVLDSTNGLLPKLMNAYKQIQYNGYWKFGTVYPWNSTNENVLFSNMQYNLYKATNWWLRCLRYMYYNYGYKTNTIRRLRGIYLYLKKFHKVNNLYQFKQLHLKLDTQFFSHDMQMSVSEWDTSSSVGGNGKLPSGTMTFWYANTMQLNGRDYLKGMHEDLVHVEELETIMSEDMRQAKTQLDSMSSYVANTLDYVFDLYMIDQIIPHVDHPSSQAYITFTSKPAYAVWNVVRDNQHPQFIPPIYNTPASESPRKLYFGIATQYRNGSYVMQAYGGIRKNCEYTFFDGTTIEESDSYSTFEFYDENGSLLQSIPCTITFQRVGNTGDALSNINVLPNTSNSHVDLQNIHETMESSNTVGNQYIVNHKVTDTNYEMLIGNRYQHLYHTYEKRLERKTMVQGSIDRVWMSNQDMNQMLLSDYGAHIMPQMFFKPTHILHATVDENHYVEDIGRGYFEGQHVYLETNDELHYIFPAIITAVSHAPHRGFIEAKPDLRHCKWLEIKDKALMKTYLNGNIECRIVDDNIQNILDEYTNQNYVSYYNPTYETDLEYTDEDYPEMLSVLEDELPIQSNAIYQYNRIAPMFNHLHRSTYPDEKYATWRFIYMGTRYMPAFEDGTDPDYNIYLVNVNRSTLTDPELYSILRQDPNDHDVRKLEEIKFQSKIDELTDAIEKTKNAISIFRKNLSDATTLEDKEFYTLKLQDASLRVEKYETMLDFYKDALSEPEPSTTWYNVTSYDTAKTYLDNNRTMSPKTYQFDVRDIPYTSKLKIFLYDHDNHEWYSEDDFLIFFRINLSSTNTFDLTDSCDGSYVKSIQFIKIRLQNGSMWKGSNHVSVYFAYNQSDVFSDLTNDNNTCQVRFQPILSTNHDPKDESLYSNLKIRKHLDLNEEYQLNNTELSNTILPKKEWDVLYEDHKPNLEWETNQMCIKIDRSRIHRGDHPYIPTPRFCHMTINVNGVVETCDEYQIMVKQPFLDTNTQGWLYEQTYTCTIVQPIDQFRVGEIVNIICINNQQANYNGNISSVMFQGITGLDENDNQTITITSSNVTIDPGFTSFTCTVTHDTQYASEGGLLVIDVNRNRISRSLLDMDGNWYQIPNGNLRYMEIPDEFIIVPHQSYSSGMEASISISVTYKKITPDMIAVDNSNLMNPFEFYYDYHHKLRYPISNVRHSQHDKRLSYLGNGGMTHTSVVQTNCLHVCRYSLSDIPRNGLLDITGYIPTPLSMHRYEFWVNGRQLTHEHIIILSPTSFQLIHLTSLKNLEVIELVEDYLDTPLSPKNIVYMDLKGNVYTTYKQAFLSNQDVIHQAVQYQFYGFPNHTNLQNNTRGFISNPNNVDIETNIMKYWETEGEDLVTDYDAFYNIPRLNGVPLYHPNTTDLGMFEIPIDEIIKVYDHTWRYEITTNPFFPTTHLDDSMSYDQQYIIFHVLYKDNKYWVYAKGTYSKYFTIYVSKSETASIYNLEKTMKIIPLIKAGTCVLLDADTRGLWLHATIPNYVPKKIQ